MRLGQLARELNTKPEEIVSFLKKEKNIIMKTHPNCKVDDEFIDALTNHFKPTGEEVVATPIIEEKKVEKTPPKIEEETPAPAAPIEQTEPKEPQELKIIGKIDLPQKKDVPVEIDGVVYDQATLDDEKKETLKAEREKKALEKEEKKKAEAEARRLAKEKRELEAERKAMLATEKNNQLSKEVERKKAAILKAQQEREEKLKKKRKKRQAKHYKENFSTKKKNKASKKPVDEPKAPIITSSPDIKEEVKEKSIVKRFIKWLNT